MAFDFNTLLHRKLKSGSQYNGLIPAYSNTSIIQEKKNEESDVYDSLIFMQETVKKYANQYNKVAPLLRRKTTAETVNNVFRFLYDHHQYKIDNDLQKLYSPAAAWHFREIGFDCKTFSILAVSLFQCLGITSAFRMVKQRGLKDNLGNWIVNPNYWSHVYVIVPIDNNKYYVVDATTHDNVEVQFTQKHDIIMKHAVLNGANIYARQQSLNCSCQGQPIQKTGLGNPATFQKTIANFHNFLNELERNGVSRQVTDKMLGLVRFNVERGIDPNMTEIFEKATAQNQGSLGFNVASGVQSGVASASNSISIGGSSITQIGQAISGDPAALSGIASKLITKIIPMDFINKTFGAVFANGFNLSCWGASLTPQDATNRLKVTYQPHFNKLLQNIDSAQTIYAKNEAVNKFLLDAYKIGWYYTQYKIGEAGWSSCAKKAINEVYKPFFLSIMSRADVLVQDLISQGATKTVLSNIGSSYIIPTSSTGQKEYKSKKSDSVKVKIDIPQLDIKNLTKPTIVNNGNGTTTITFNGETKTISNQEYINATGQNPPAPVGGNTGNGSAGNGNVGSTTKSTSNAGLLTGVAVAGILAKIFFF